MRTATRRVINQNADSRDSVCDPNAVDGPLGAAVCFDTHAVRTTGKVHLRVMNERGLDSDPDDVLGSAVVMFEQLPATRSWELARLPHILFWIIVWGLVFGSCRAQNMYGCGLQLCTV